MPDEEKNGEKRNSENGSQEEYVPGPWDTVAEGIKNLLQRENIAKSIADYITAEANNKARQPNLAKTWGVLGIVFNMVIFIGVGYLGTRKVISPEAVTGLLGALIGYWFGHRQINSSRK